MGNIEVNVSFPLDDGGFFRRECPFCHRDFKVLLAKEELNTLTQEGIDSFLIESKRTSDSEERTEQEVEYFCPYCGQRASKDSWWTQEQLAYINGFAKNIIANIFNEKFSKLLKGISSHQNSGPVSISFKGQEMEQLETWISPEVNDMDVFDLPCCHRQIKIENSKTGCIYCFFCGFPHECV